MKISREMLLVALAGFGAWWFFLRKKPAGAPSTGVNATPTGYDTGALRLALNQLIGQAQGARASAPTPEPPPAPEGVA